MSAANTISLSVDACELPPRLHLNLLLSVLTVNSTAAVARESRAPCTRGARGAPRAARDTVRRRGAVSGAWRRYLSRGGGSMVRPAVSGTGG